MVARSKQDAAIEAALEAAEAAQAAAEAAKAAQAAAEAARQAAQQAEQAEEAHEREAPGLEELEEVEPEVEATKEADVEDAQADGQETAEKPQESAATEPEVRATRASSRRLVPLLGAAAVLLGCFAFWSHQKVQDINDDAAAKNTALTDNATTSQVKGEITTALNRIFSYDYTNPAKTDQAAKASLTGKAVGEYATLFAGIRQQAPTQKLVLTTTVTDGAVRALEGDRARLLLYADQRSTSAVTGQDKYAGAMLAVDAVRQDGHWEITNLDTFPAAQ